jgi:hypothetical protein
MRRILLATLAGLGLAASVQAIARQIAPNTMHECELAALPKELGRGVCAPYDPAEGIKIQSTHVTPGNGLKTPSVRDALTQMRPQPGPSAITVVVGVGHGLGTTPQMLVRVGEQAPTAIEMNTNTEGSVTECRVVNSSGSDRLDSTACDFVKDQWPRLKLLLTRTR